jgi:hypothetical protein
MLVMRELTNVKQRRAISYGSGVGSVLSRAKSLGRVVGISDKCRRALNPVNRIFSRTELLDGLHNNGSACGE